MLIFEVFLLLREPLVGKFKKMRAVTSPKDLVKQDMKISKAWQKQFSPGFALKIASEILTFAGFFTSKMTNGGYFQ